MLAVSGKGSNIGGNIYQQLEKREMAIHTQNVLLLTPNADIHGQF